MSTRISIVGIQIMPSKERKTNLKNALSLIDEAAAFYKQIDMIVLPEHFYVLEKGKTAGYYPEEVMEALSVKAYEYQTYIVGGTILNRRMSSGKLYNTSVFFDRDGNVAGSYDKIHLFDGIDCADNEKEAAYCEHGEQLFTWDTDFGKIGIVVGYDIRFPELVRTLALQGVRYLMIPAAFYSPRDSYWTDIIKGIALYNSMYVIGVNLYGKLSEDCVFFGKSLIVDPGGVTVAGASDQPGFFQAYIDTDYPNIVEARVGSFMNRRPSSYDIPKAEQPHLGYSSWALFPNKER